MQRVELLKKVEANEGLTVEEIKEYRKIVKEQKHTYGKYGTLALKYLEEHNQGKLWALQGDLPDYLHNIDKQASELYEIMYEKLSAKDEYKKTGDYISDLKKETTIQTIINETILNQLVYETE